MKKVILVLSFVITLAGCTDVKGYESDISSLELEVEEMTTNLSNVEKDNEELITEIEKLINEKNKIKKDYDDYKKRMEPYEELESSEAEARKIEADKIAAEEKAAKEKRKAEEKAAKKAEEEAEEKRKAEEEVARKAEQEAADKAEEEKIAQGYETGITFEQLARTPDDYLGEKVKFSGKVVQVIEGDGETELRFAVNDNYDQVIYIGYSSDIVNQRVLEDDYLTIYGNSLGTISYESTFGATITIPAVYVDKINFN